jgi:hypothetical protein
MISQAGVSAQRCDGGAEGTFHAQSELARQQLTSATPASNAKDGEPIISNAMNSGHAKPTRLFASAYMAGFECSTHRRSDGRRLDLSASTCHDARAAEDYAQVRRHGLLAARDGLRWHRIETTPRRYDWSSFLPMLRAANAAGMQVIWDLCHYGLPDDLDIWSGEFVTRFAAFAQNVARLVKDEGTPARAYCPVNEISYWAWAGGDVARINPCATGRGTELKAQLVRAAIAAIDAVRNVDPEARIVHSEPAIHVIAQPLRPNDAHHAELYRLSQWEAWEMLAGRLRPDLGGDPSYLDVLGLNYYPDNQWYLGGGTIPLGHHAYRPLRDIVLEVSRRYGRPMLISETGAEGSGKAAWLHYISDEVRAARAAGAPIEAICLYPILDYPGWENERECAVGLLKMADTTDGRVVEAALAAELARQTADQWDAETDSGHPRAVNLPSYGAVG